jgi:uncharacterized membrane protein
LCSVLTTGVMIALALIPSLAIFGMAAALGEGGLAARAFARWALDAAIVIVFGGGVFWLKARFFHRTRSLEQRP